MPEIILYNPEQTVIRCFSGYSDYRRGFEVEGIDELGGDKLQGEIESFTERRLVVINYIIDKSFVTEEDTYWAVREDDKAKDIINEFLPILTQDHLARLEIQEKRAARKLNQEAE